MDRKAGNRPAARGRNDRIRAARDIAATTSPDQNRGEAVKVPGRTNLVAGRVKVPANPNLSPAPVIQVAAQRRIRIRKTRAQERLPKNTTSQTKRTIKPQPRVLQRPIAIRLKRRVPKALLLALRTLNRNSPQASGAKGQLLAPLRRTVTILSIREPKALRPEQPHPIAIRHNIPASKVPQPEQQQRIVINLSIRVPKALQPGRRRLIVISRRIRELKAQR